MILLRALWSAFYIFPLVQYVFGIPKAHGLRQNTPRPLVIWHGMGDSYASDGMLEMISRIEDMHSGIFVHSVYLAENDDDDKKAGFVREYRCSMLSAY